MLKSIKNYFTKKRPDFPSLKEFPFKDKYFYRTATWTSIDNNTDIIVFDPQGGRIITFDPWPRLVFLDALGNSTVSEYIDYLSSSYTSQIPDQLDEIVLYQLNMLADQKLIAYSNNPVTLDPTILNSK